MIHNKALLSTLNSQIPHRLPIWFMRQAGRYLPEYLKIRKEAGSFLNLCYTPELACEVTLQPLRRFDLDAAILFSDILVVLDAIGFKVEYLENEGPKVSLDQNKSKEINFVEEEFHQFLNPVYQTIGLLKQKLPEHITLIGFSGAPWTLFCYAVEGKTSRDFAIARAYIYNNPQRAEMLIKVITEAVIAYTIKQIESGADCIQLFDSWAGVLNEKDYERLVIAPNKTIIQAIRKKYPQIPIIGFPKASGWLYPRYIEETKVSAVGIDTTVPITAMKELRNKCIIQGNLDPILMASSIDNSIIFAKNLWNEFGKERFIFNLGHGMMPITPVQNVEVLINAIRKFG